MSPSLIKSLMDAVTTQLFAMEQENRALRELLRRQGLSDATIRRKVAAYLKVEDDRKIALQRLSEVCEEMLKRLPAFSAEELLAEIPIEGKPQ